MTAPGSTDLDASAVTVVLLLVLGASAPVGAAAEHVDRDRTLASDASISTVPVGASPSASSTSGTIDLRQTLQLTPNAPGEIAVTLRYSLPTDVVDLKTRVPTDATVASTDGFDRSDGTEYVWDQRTTTPTLTYRTAVNETRDATGPIAGNGDYLFVDPGKWALVRIPPTASEWSWTGGGTVELSRTTTTAGPGAVGDAMAFLGEHREVTRTAHGQTFRLIVPARASLAESPSAILASMASASETLRVGDRDERVFAVAAPTRSTRWAVRGLQTGESDMWVRDIERLDTADNTWLHEYVHTRQGYAAAKEVRWFTEASASYYAALLALGQQRIDFEAFRNRLARGMRSPDTTAVLADPSTWDTVAPYTKGALVASELGRQTRLASNRTRSLQDVLRRMNGHGDTVTASAFREMVRRSGGDDTASLADRYATGRETPPMWDRPTHERAFSTTPPRIEYALPEPRNSSGYRVSGPYRSVGIDGDRPLRLAVDETLAVDVRVSNTGGATGEYDAGLFANGERQDRRSGSLAPGESRTVTLGHRFSKVGEYALTVAGEEIAVSVRDPAAPTVTALDVERTHRRHGDRRGVAATATVRNERAFPAAGNLTLYRNGEPVETRRIELAPDEERTVGYDETFVDPGTHVFRVGNRTVTITLESTSTPTTESETTSAVDGFGVASALIAIVGLLLLLGRRP